MREFVFRQINWFQQLVSCLGVWGAIRFRLAELLRRKTVTININGTTLLVRPKTPDFEVGRDSLGPELEPIGDFLPPDFSGVILDAGGYIGSAALKLSQMYPLARIVSIEPAQQNFQMLLRNVSGNTRIEAINAALSHRSGDLVDLKDPGKGEWGFTTVQNPYASLQAPVIEAVGTITIADIQCLYPGEDIGLMKLDIEGGEKALFEKASDTLAQIPLIFTELHDRLVSGCSAAFQTFSNNRTVHSFGGEKFLSASEVAKPAQAPLRKAG